MAHELLELGTVVVNGPDIDDTEPVAVELLVIPRLEVGAAVSVLSNWIRVDFDFLEVFHDRESYDDKIRYINIMIQESSFYLRKYTVL